VSAAINSRALQQIRQQISFLPAQDALITHQRIGKTVHYLSGRHGRTPPSEDTRAQEPDSPVSERGSEAYHKNFCGKAVIYGKES
jgi:hypothetical protein